ncbi:helix-turn-helix domain-containing protein [Corynebacterium flavescens]|uniref:helix-turn-helix domain-containing protein n=1 Tax=Corynebacterium flavescens TaxID=28028 RepID=UPI002649DC2E|nr:helix-turn-helix transcriptional regulator [Corynebacterium flavescens]MDN6822934.1 helix-turn-helix domain-containing protein [Corynebacterium flavescens]
MSENKQILQEFGDRLRAARKSQSLSQEALAHLAGLDRTYVSGVERGERNISLQNIVRLAKTLCVDPGVLVSGLERMESDESGNAN